MKLKRHCLQMTCWKAYYRDCVLYGINIKVIVCNEAVSGVTEARPVFNHKYWNRICIFCDDVVMLVFVNYMVVR